jgi:M6 family metalloprotease-like protein
MHTRVFALRARLALPALAVALFLLLLATSAGSASADDGTRGGGVGPMVPGGKPRLGPQPFANIMCKFKDVTNEPRDVAYIKQLIGINPISGRTVGSVAPSLDHYWREVSYGAIDLDGSKVYGWVTLPGKEEDYYERDAAGDPIPSFRVDGLFSQDSMKLAKDCTAAAEAQVVNPDGSRGIPFNLFTGVNLFFNGRLDGASGGAPRDLKLDNTLRAQLPITWIASNQMEQYVLAHEMGHAFGLPHSSSPYDETYGSPYDLMSEGRDCYNFHDTSERRADYPFGCVALHTIAAHKAYLGWMPAARRFDVKPGPATTITLSRLAQPVTATGVDWMAKLPIRGDARRYYTVELRTQRGYDAGVDGGIIGDAVVIHKVDETLMDRNAKVVDADNNGNVGDFGSEWAAGESFTDAANGITIRVESISLTTGTARVTLTQAPLISINDVTVHEPAPAPPPSNDPEPEPDPGFLFSKARFTVRLAAPATVPVTVSYTAVNGTAKLGVDYLLKNGSVTIPAGATTATITADVMRDNLNELPETFFVNLGNSVNGKILDGVGKGTILDFD